MITAADIGGVLIVVAYLGVMLAINWWQDQRRQVCWTRTCRHAWFTLARGEQWPEWGVVWLDGAYEYALFFNMGCWNLRLGLYKPEWQDLWRGDTSYTSEEDTHNAKS